MSDYCMFGCYPVDKFFYEGKGLEIKEVLSLANLDDNQKKDFEERMKEYEIEHICDIVSFKKVIDMLIKLDMEIGEKIIDKMKEKLKYKKDLGEPYVNKEDKTLVVISNTQGKAMNTFRYMTNLLDARYGWKVHKVKEWLNISPRSQLYEEMSRRRRDAEQTLAQVMMNINQLYQEKHLIEHDLRKVRERQKSFKEAENNKKKSEKDKESKGKTIPKEEALKADFIDLVDINTQQHSILQMQSNNIFPTITADFYRMTSEDDLNSKKEGGSGFLADLPESEKAVLRKKWKLYEMWKDEYKNYVHEKVSDLEKRLNSINMSIKQTEEWLRPYIRTILQSKTTDEADLDKITNKHFIQGYSTSWRALKLISFKDVREKDDEKTHFDVLVTFIDHLTLANSQNPAAPGQGPESLIYSFKEYLVCKHVHNIAFQKQIDEKAEEVKRFLRLYIGEKPWEDVVESELREKKKENEKDKEKKKDTFKRGTNFQLSMGKWDKFHVPLEEIPSLRKKIIGPEHSKAELYLDMKFGTRMFTMV